MPLFDHGKYKVFSRTCKIDRRYNHYISFYHFLFTWWRYGFVYIIYNILGRLKSEIMQAHIIIWSWNLLVVHLLYIYLGTS